MYGFHAFVQVSATSGRFCCGNGGKAQLHAVGQAVHQGVLEAREALGNFGGDIAGIWNGNYAGNNASTKEQILTGMKGVLNVGLNIVGNLAAIYNLGFGTVTNNAKDAAIPEFPDVAGY